MFPILIFSRGMLKGDVFWNQGPLGKGGEVNNLRTPLDIGGVKSKGTLMEV